MRSIYRKQMHLIAKYKGNNGDLIIGRIDSVRSNGDLVGVNLLTGSRFTKHESVVASRNVICSKRVAMRILKEAGGDRKIARTQAVFEAAQIQSCTPQLLARNTKTKIEKLVESLHKLPAREFLETIGLAALIRTKDTA